MADQAPYEEQAAAAEVAGASAAAWAETARGEQGERGHAMAEPRPSAAEQLSSLLERERACVAVAVALANGATELAERAACTSLGARLILHCCALRERLALAGEPITLDTSPEVTTVLATETYDARLLGFAALLEQTAEQASEALAAPVDGEAQRTLRDMLETH